MNGKSIQTPAPPLADKPHQSAVVHVLMVPIRFLNNCLLLAALAWHDL